MKEAKLKVVRIDCNDVITTSGGCPMPGLSSTAYKIGYAAIGGYGCEFYLDLDGNDAYDDGTDVWASNYRGANIDAYLANGTRDSRLVNGYDDPDWYGYEGSYAHYSLSGGKLVVQICGDTTHQ